jgi:hypothetical protein
MNEGKPKSFNTFSPNGIIYIAARLIAFTSDIRKAFKICTHTMYMKISQLKRQLLIQRKSPYDTEENMVLLSE